MPANTPEASTGNRNMAREKLDALTSQDGLNVWAVRLANGNEISLRVSISTPVRTRPNNPKPVPGRPDSTITDIDVGEIKVKHTGATVKVHFRIAEADSTGG